MRGVSVLLALATAAAVEPAWAAMLPPANLIVLPGSVTSSSAALLWDKPVADDRVVGYEVYQDGKFLATTAPDRTFYEVIGLVPGHDYNFHVVAREGNGTRSGPTADVPVTTAKIAAIIDVTAPPYGAKPDGHTKNTTAIQRAIDDCPPGRGVTVPAGVFVTGPLVLKSDMFFHLERGAVLKGSVDAADYLPLIHTRYMGLEVDCCQPLIRIGVMDRSAGFTTRNVTLYGEGEIRGGGETLGLQQVYDQRSQLILIQNAENVAVMGLHLTFPGGWTVHPLYSKDITAFKIWIESWDAFKGKSGDGFDPDSSTNCYLVDSIVHSWDNSFSPKSGRGMEGYQIARPTRHVRVVGCVLEHGAPSLGSEVSGGIEDVVVRDSTVIGTYFYIKTNDGRGGFIRDFTLDNVEFKGGCDRSVWVDTNYEVRNSPPKAPVLTECGRYRFHHLRGAGSISLDGRFQWGTGPARASYIHQVEFSDIVMQPGATVSLQCCDGVKFERVRCADGLPPEYIVEGANFGLSVDGRSLNTHP